VSGKVLASCIRLNLKFILDDKQVLRPVQFSICTAP
jgi:hypothetical protein